MKKTILIAVLASGAISSFAAGADNSTTVPSTAAAPTVSTAAPAAAAAAAEQASDTNKKADAASEQTEKQASDTNKKTDAASEQAEKQDPDTNKKADAASEQAGKKTPDTNKETAAASVQTEKSASADAQDDSRWTAEKKTVEAFAKSINAMLFNRKEIASGKKDELSLEDIGKRFTANVLAPLGPEDFTLGGLTIGRIPEGPILDWTNRTVKGYFETYSGSTGYYTVYTGPTGTDSDALRREGLAYHYAGPVVTDIHVSGGDFKTNRNIGIGTLRGELLFAYGSPSAMWRNPADNSLVLLYEGKGDNPSSKRYLVFTLKDSRVSRIDMVDGQVWVKNSLPEIKMTQFEANKLVPADFSLMGYRIDQKFAGSPDETWNARGNVFGDPFISYPGYLVAYDKRSLVSRVMVTNQSAVTRRGVTIGDTKFMMLYLYGEPTFTEPGLEGGEDKTVVYGYAEPNSIHRYLLFTVSEKKGYIESVMLSDRPMSELKAKTKTES